MNQEELRKRYDVILDCWNLMKKYSGLQDKDEFWQNLIRESQEIYEKHGKTAFAKEQVESVVNELDRCFKEMRKNGEKKQRI